MRRQRTGTDHGQTTVEFLGMAPLILLVLVLLWQFVLVGYTFTLAGNAADEAARACALGENAGAAATRDLPGAWQAGASTSCARNPGGMSTAGVDLKVPVLFPGSVNFPFTVTGSAGAASEAPE
ncbi:TadE/TadG family type IV pilus assembly protein [Streptomyces sp. 549]|uniref:TadE/TadG family type IV pilus assembly protein n=1 Tax=Streptomyces sp. 549 TaxID=3049076 RepID=UPI0024C296E0|nr:TadE/TadG family type IV pilus assembly protein [Streptomyces sp. 549]MDK1476619.1 TadE/TadG family type IV pilus assembly protein [Streptomyces sp. 549]